MTTKGIKPGDILEVEAKDQVFLARATSSLTTQSLTNRRGIEIQPLRPDGHIPSYFVTAQQIVGHYPKRKGSR